MKNKTFIIVLLLVSTIISSAQEKAISWPIKGELAGKGIISKPQDFIDKELNFSHLIISSVENAEVIAPYKGMVKSFSYVYYKSLSYVSSFNYEYDESLGVSSFDMEFRKKIGKDNNLNPDHLSIRIGIETKKGEMYYITGLRPVKYFKTGTEISEGQTIGKVGYSYHKTKQPSIHVERSINGKPADPMGVFGLNSTFLPPQKSTINYLTYKHPIETLIEDFKIFKSALEEGHPGLYDYITKEQLNTIFQLTEAKIISPMTSEEFYLLLLPILKEIKDSHTVLIPKQDNSPKAVPTILFGLKNDSLTVFSTLPQYEEFLHKNIVSIDGENVKDIIPKLKIFVNGNDGFIKTLEDRWLILYFWNYYGQYKSKGKGDKILIQFKDGSKETFDYHVNRLESYIPIFIKKSSGRFSTKILNPQTALLDINTFVLLEKDIDSIADFIKYVSKNGYQNLIFDVRDNSGGDEKNIKKIYAMIANQSFRTTSHQKVNSNSNYAFLQNSINYPPNHILFPAYQKVENKDGYYLTEEHFHEVKPDKNIHFGGKVYVLINELSRSASTVFPALVYKQKRGVLVGRETGSTYYQLNALDFANVNLKNSGLMLITPLINVVFDELENEKIPWGRGVIPNYTVPIDFKEFTGNEDLILNMAIAEIEKEQKLEPKKGNNKWVIYVLIWVFVIVVFFLFKKHFYKPIT